MTQTGARKGKGWLKRKGIGAGNALAITKRGACREDLSCFCGVPKKDTLHNMDHKEMCLTVALQKIVCISLYCIPPTVSSIFPVNASSPEGQ
jgi:hypothetical protein